MAVQPTRLVLDGRADYIEDGDTVLVVVYVTDPDLEMGFPGHVRSGTCALLYKNQEIRRISFDRRFGNGEGAEGDFVFQFSHPPCNRDMKIRLEVEAPLVQGQNQSGILRKTIPVTKADTPFIPIQQQPDTGPNANGELRSKLRIEEEI